MNRRQHLLALTASALATGGAQAQPAPAPVELAGVRFPPSVALGGSTLQLNGAGIRFRFVIRVYAAGLYLPAKATTAEQVLAMAGPRRLQIHMLRDIDANELGRLFTRGMQDNAPREEFSKSIPGTLRLAEMFAQRKRLRSGDYFSVDYVPGTGTQVVINGKPEGEPVKEPEFFTALMRIWLGSKPADDALKDALLGKASAAPVTGQN